MKSSEIVFLQFPYKEKASITKKNTNVGCGEKKVTKTKINNQEKR